MAMYGTTPEGAVIKALEVMVNESEALSAEVVHLRAENERMRAALCYVADNTMETHTLYRALTALRGEEEK